MPCCRLGRLVVVALSADAFGIRRYSGLDQNLPSLLSRRNTYCATGSRPEILPRAERFCQRLERQKRRAAAEGDDTLKVYEGDAAKMLDDLFDDQDDEDGEEDYYLYGSLSRMDEAASSYNRSTISIPSSLSFESLSSNVSYFYLRHEIGLSEQAMWRIAFDASSVLGMTTDTIRKKVEVLSENMNLSKDDLRSIIERQPTILQLSAEKNIAPSILFLVRALDMGKGELRQLILALPSLLNYRKEAIKSKINFFTRVMQYSVAECRNLLLAEPKLLRCSVRTGLVPRMRFLVREIETPLEKFRQMVQKHPRLLLYSLENNLIPKLIFYFIMTLHMKPNHVHKLLLTYPALLDYNLDRHILPISRYFINDLEVSPTEFRGIILKFPRLMTHSLIKIKHVVGYLRFELGLSGSQVKRVLYQAPQVVGLNAEKNLRSKVDFLRREFSLNDDQLKGVVAGMPTLLVLSVARNLEPKAKYLSDAFESDQAAVSQAVRRLPTLLGYSLSKRLQPRMEAILEADLDPSCITVGVPMKQDRFDGWLRRRSDKSKSKSDSLSSPSSIIVAEDWSQRKDPSLPPPLSDSLVPSSKRIVHWTRERRRQ